MVSLFAYDDVRAAQEHIQRVKTRVTQPYAGSVDAIDALLEDLTALIDKRVKMSDTPTSWPSVNDPWAVEECRAALHHLKETAGRLTATQATQAATIKNNLLTLISDMGGTHEPHD